MTTNVKLENCYSWLYTDNEDLKTILWKALRFREKNYYHSRLYKQKIWDGYTEFFKKESGRFLSGLWPEVQYALKELGVRYKLLDKRQQFGFDTSTIDSNFIPGVDLYSYQVDLVNQLIKHKRGIIQAPTAAGKSMMMTAILKALPEDCPAIVTSKSVSLVDQVYRDMVEHNVPGAGKVFGSRKKDFQPGMKTAVNIDSIHKLESLFPHIRCLIVDEVHLMMSKKPKKFYNKLKACSVRAGVSATPFKFGGKDMTQKYNVKGYFGPILRTAEAGKEGVLTTEKLQLDGRLSKSDCTFFPIKEPALPYEIYIDAVTLGIAENWHFHKVVQKLVSSLKGRSLILVERLAHGDALASMIPGAVWVQGKDNIDTRRYVIEKLQKDEHAVAIATVGIFNAGINVFIHNLINAAGGQADHQIIQRMGRGLRTASDKEILNYYDFIFEINDYLLDHSHKRVRILKEEGHNVEIKEALDF